MIEIRLAQKGETARQKEIWKLCFGDDNAYIDFYFANRYKENETILLLQDGEIGAMLTMIPASMVAPNNRSYSAAMFYAIATHPQYQRRGFATQLMDFSHSYLRAANTEFSILVPAEKQVFNFYRKRGYREGFFIREVLLTGTIIDNLPSCRFSPYSISATGAEEYNLRRRKQFSGGYYIAYADEEITYQKKLSRQSGADIYAIDAEGIQGCAAIERVSCDKVLIKEILLPEEQIGCALKRIAQLLPAKEYLVRTPAYSGHCLGGRVRPFGMIKAQTDINFEMGFNESGYLGLAFD